MQTRFFSLGLTLAVLLTACSGGQTTSLPRLTPSGVAPQGTTRKIDLSHVTTSAQTRHAQDASGALADGGFESGNFTAWQQCGNVNASIQSSVVHSGTYAAQSGSASSEPNGDAGVCQSIVVPTGGKLSLYVRETTNETNTKYADQEGDLLDANGYVLTSLFNETNNTNAWQLRTYDLSGYGGQTVYLYFGVHGNGAANYHIAQYVDDLTFGTAGPTPTPAPTSTATATPRPTATPTATAQPTSTPTATPKPTSTPTATPKPTSTPTATPAPTSTPTNAPTPTPAPSGYPTPVPCDDAGFLKVQAAHPSGYTEVAVCGTVTQVLPEKTTSSGLHKYFYVQVSSGVTIEIVTNIGETGEFTVNVGDYANVHGRYYYDNSSSQGIDWTHHNNAGASWPYPGYVQFNNGPLIS